MNSQIYKEIETSDLEKIIKDLHGSAAVIESHHILKGGLFNTTYFVKTNCDNGLVVRVAPINKHLLLQFEKDMMSAEPIFHKLFKDYGIPTSNVIKYSRAGSVIDREYIITEFINSKPMQNVSWFQKTFKLMKVYKKAGELTAKIHSIHNNKFGFLREHNNYLFDTWFEFVVFYMEDIIAKLSANDLFTPGYLEKVKDIIFKAKDILNEIKEPQLTHMDLWQGNILVDKDLKIVAIIDLDRAIFGDKYWDIATPWMINKAFLKGYNSPLSSDQNHNKRMQIYKLLNALRDAYVWKVEYDDQKQFEVEKQKAIKALRGFYE